MSYKETSKTTCFDAIASKSSAQKKGYFKDDKLHLVSKPHPVIKDPMINRGTWFRVDIFAKAVQAFLNTYPLCQVLVLGAGLDTLFWRLQTKQDQRFIELDLPEICQLKAQKLDLQKTEFGYTAQEAPQYELCGADLEEEFIEGLKMNPATPTMIISDVVLSYLESDATVALNNRLLKYFEQVQVLYFEIINPHDAFGDQMIYNMSQREIFLPTFAEIGYVENYSRQLTQGGLTPTVANAWSVYNKWPGRSEIEKLEMLDEFEQFQLIMEHYAVIFGQKNISKDLNIFSTL